MPAKGGREWKSVPNALAAEAGPAERERMTTLFELTVRYETAFWELAYGRAAGWPWIEERA